MPIVAPPPAANPEFQGHPEALAALRQALASGRCPHGWLFHGRQGVGKATLAYRFARALLAPEGAPDATLGLDPAHPVARQVAAGAHPDLEVLQPPERGAKEARQRAEIPVDLIRKATAAFHGTPALAGRRVLLVDGAELMNRNAANALLKPLEEPPPRAVLILVSHRPAQVLPTLRSRCAKLAFGGLPAPLLQQLLARYADGYDSATLAAVTGLARGSIGTALALLEADWLSAYQSLLRHLADAPQAQGLQELAEQLGKRAGRGEFDQIAGLLQELFKRLLDVALDRPVLPLFEAEPALLRQLAGRRPLDRWAALWDKIGRLAATVDGLNLDHAQALLQILTLIATPAEAASDPAAAPLLLEGHHGLA